MFIGCTSNSWKSEWKLRNQTHRWGKRKNYGASREIRKGEKKGWKELYLVIHGRRGIPVEEEAQPAPASWVARLPPPPFPTVQYLPGARFVRAGIRWPRWGARGGGRWRRRRKWGVWAWRCMDEADLPLRPSAHGLPARPHRRGQEERGERSSREVVQARQGRPAAREGGSGAGRS